MRKSEAVVEKLERQRKEIAALKSRLKRANDNVALWKHRWERDKRG